MKLFANFRTGAERSQGTRRVEDSDTPVNQDDQATDIESRLWKLRGEAGLERMLELISPLSMVMLGMGAGFIARRKFGLVLLPLLGLVVQRAFSKQRPSRLARRLGVRSREEIDLERYALKLQRGDYGKMEVIPFR